MKRLSGAYWFNLAHEGALPGKMLVEMETDLADAAAMDVVDVLDEPIPLPDLIDEQPAQIP